MPSERPLRQPASIRGRVAACLLPLLLVAAGIGPVEGREPPLAVFVLVGQSNMQGHAHVRTLEAMGMDPETVPLYREMVKKDGTPRVLDDVWISYLSSGGVKQGQLTTGFGADGDKLGPELAFGVTMRKRLGRPLLIIKAAWGGKSLHTDFRPPGAGPYELTAAQTQQLERQGRDVEAFRAQKAKESGVYYRLMHEHVRSVLADLRKVVPSRVARRGHELMGFVWFQGWNDMVDAGAYPDRDQPGGYDLYARLLTRLIQDVRKDLEAPKLPFVIGVLGVGGPVSGYGPSEQRYAKVHQNFRDAMAAPAKDGRLGGNVFAVLTERHWDPELGALVDRDGAMRREVEKRRKDEGLTREEEQEELERQRAKAFSAAERRLLEKGVSNAAYHYLGSAKILSRIGEAFAEALPAMEENR